MGRKYHAKIFTKEPQRRQIIVFLVVLFSCVLMLIGEFGFLKTIVKQNEKKLEQKQKAYFQSLPIEKEPIRFEKFLKKHKKYWQQFEKIQKAAICFPIPAVYWKDIRFEDSWGKERTFSGNRTHEGCDIMAFDNTRGKIPVISMSDGVVENKGWLTLGGWRLGIRTLDDIYFYYAHLYSYADGIEVGDRIYAGQLLGFMGDSGYGKEGTVGQFDVHLHMGIYLKETNGVEWSINPYGILKFLERKEN